MMTESNQLIHFYLPDLIHAVVTNLITAQICAESIKYLIA